MSYTEFSPRYIGPELDQPLPNTAFQVHDPDLNRHARFFTVGATYIAPDYSKPIEVQTLLDFANEHNFPTKDTCGNTHVKPDGTLYFDHQNKNNTQLYIDAIKAVLAVSPQTYSWMSPNLRNDLRYYGNGRAQKMFNEAFPDDPAEENQPIFEPSGD